MDLEDMTQRELVTYARKMIRKGYFRLVIAGDESKGWLIVAIRDMETQLQRKQK